MTTQYYIVIKASEKRQVATLKLDQAARYCAMYVGHYFIPAPKH